MGGSVGTTRPQDALADQEGDLDMELLFVLGAVIALDAIRNGDVDTYRVEMERMERDIARGTWRRF